MNSFLQNSQLSIPPSSSAKFQKSINWEKQFLAIFHIMTKHLSTQQF